MINTNTLFWIALQNFVNAVTYAKRSPYITSENQPDYTKAYSSKRNLFASRVFKPAGTNETKLPLVIHIHGGGFIMNSPMADDLLARYLSTNANCVVISMDYSKAPRYKFPAAYEDLIAQILAAIEDTQLGIDPDRVVVCGSSSGGNLALGIAQDPRLRPKLLGVLASTPVVDFITPFEEKMATRPDPNVPDFLSSNYRSIVGVYIGDQDVSLEDMRISPDRFKSRQDLPEHMYLTGVEHDLLSKEAELMAEKLADGQEKRKTEMGWETANVKWDHIKGQKHAFESFAAKEKKAEEARVRAVDASYQAMADWLKAVFEKTSAS